MTTPVFDNAGYGYAPAVDRVSAAAWAAALAVFAVVALAGAVQIPLALNHDVAWIATGTRRLIDGAVFGRGVIDVTPPLAWWILLAPAAANKWLGVELGLAVKLYVFGLGLASLALGWRLSARMLPVKAAGTFIAAVSAVFFLLPSYDFGQREHLMVLLAFPYLVLCGLRADTTSNVPSRAATIAVGAMAALGICLKPFFLLIPAMVELWLLWRTRRFASIFRAETVAMGVVGLVYAISIPVFAGAYLTEVAPSVVATYQAYSNPLVLVLQTTMVSLGGTAVLALVWIRFARESDLSLAAVLMSGALGATAAAIVQSKGWSYHLLPGNMLLAMACAAAFCSIVQPSRIHRGLAVLTLLTVLLAPLYTYLADSYATTGTQSRVERLADAFGRGNPRPLLIAGLTTSPRDIQSAVVEARATWALNECCLHFVLAAINDELGLGNSDSNRQQRAEIAAAQLQSILRQLVQKRPDLIVVDDASRKLAIKSQGFDLLAYVERDAAFRAFMAEYEEQQRIDHFRLFMRRRR